MHVLVVLADLQALDAQCERCFVLLEKGNDVAVCYVTPSATQLKEMLASQRRITASLRLALNGSAEKIPVFVVSGQAGDGIEDCAKAWGATVVER